MTHEANSMPLLEDDFTRPSRPYVMGNGIGLKFDGPCLLAAKLNG